jgi:sugar (pentulose or hexulose) kinase
MIPVPVIVIFDVGKTNKKFFLIDEGYSIVLERSVHLEEITDEDGDACDDVNCLAKWVKESLTEILLLKELEVKAVNFSAYGASFVYINEKGAVVAPLYNYLKSYPDSLKAELYNKYGGEEKISCETASPVLGSLNSGMQVYRQLKEKPALYQQIKYALHLPQYLSFLITKQAFSDITSIGSHTQLWNFQNNKYHEWVTGEGIDKKLAPIFPCDKTISTVVNDIKIEVGAGLHDSSAALIPYLTVFSEPFILISTGTWCISLNPFNDAPLTTEELKKDSLCYLGFKGKPVKASRLFAGYEHEQQVQKLAQHFNQPADYYKKVKYDAAITDALQKEYSFSGSTEKNAEGLIQSRFVTRELQGFDSYEQAYHCLLLDIMQQQFASTQSVIQQTSVNRIFVDGGFGNNSIFMHLLALAFPQLEVYAASVAQATALGAALAIHQSWNAKPIPTDIVELKYYATIHSPSL